MPNIKKMNLESCGVVEKAVMVSFVTPLLLRAAEPPNLFTGSSAKPRLTALPHVHHPRGSQANQSNGTVHGDSFQLGI